MIRLTGAPCLLLLTAWPAPGQNTPPVSFEVASIRPAKPAGAGRVTSSRYTPGRVEFRAVSLPECIATAYRVKGFQVSAPAWLKEQRWDIVAKLPDGAPSSRIPEMLQTLLAERFKLEVHREKKDIPGFALVVGSGGPKLKKADEGSGVPAGRRMTGVRMSSGPSGGRLIAPRASMMMIASAISALTGRPVANETRIEGVYDIELEFAPEDLAAAAAAPALPQPDAGAAEAAEPRASIFSSLQRLGLKLESRKAPLEVIVVDRAEKTPTAN
jgi:uncharacterized protein (TIGR03435 family)